MNRTESEFVLEETGRNFNSSHPKVLLATMLEDAGEPGIRVKDNQNFAGNYTIIYTDRGYQMLSLALKMGILECLKGICPNIKRGDLITHSSFMKFPRQA